MARLRFETVHDLFEAFPDVRQDLMVEPTDEPSLQFLNSLAQTAPEKAVGFCAHLLPRREAVWWACQFVRSLSLPQGSEEQRALQAAEAWVKEPEENFRLAALKVGQLGDHQKPATWLALAAGWAGNTMPFDDKWVPVRPDQTARAVRAAILIAASKMDMQARTAALTQCIDAGGHLAASDPSAG
jgi:hypothetical protein